MKENKYNDPIFFEKYGSMSRSIYGLNGAAEWSSLRPLFPNLDNKTMLDCGCGYGWHCKYAIENGAKYVLGVDISEKMLSKAMEINNAPNIEYKCIAIEDLSFDDNQFDFILSSLVLHYIEDLDNFFQNVYNWLKPNGNFLFNIEHPCFTANGHQDWYYNENNEILHFPVDNYYIEGKREAIFIGEKITKYHHTLTTIINALLKVGFEITSFVEPQPPTELLDIPGMRDELRRPMMLIIKAHKK